MDLSEARFELFNLNLHFQLDSVLWAKFLAAVTFYAFAQINVKQGPFYLQGIWGAYLNAFSAECAQLGVYHGGSRKGFVEKLQHAWRRIAAFGHGRQHEALQSLEFAVNHQVVFLK